MLSQSHVRLVQKLKLTKQAANLVHWATSVLKVLHPAHHAMMEKRQTLKKLYVVSLMLFYYPIASINSFQVVNSASKITKFGGAL